MTYTTALRSPRLRTLSGSKVTKTPVVMGSIPSIERQRTNAWLDTAKRHLKQLANLDPGWNDASARSIDHAVVDGVLGFISSDLVLNLEIKPDIVPTFEGGLILEWHTESLDLLIESSPAGQVSFYYCDNETGSEVEAPLEDQMDILYSAFIKLGAW